MLDTGEHNAVDHSSTRRARLQLLKNRTGDQSVDKTRKLYEGQQVP